MIFVQEAIGIADTVETVLGSSALPSRLYERALLLPQGKVDILFVRLCSEAELTEFRQQYRLDSARP